MIHNLITFFWIALLAFLLTGSSAKAATSPPACTVIGNIGNIIIGKCVDEDTGVIIYGNSAGWMQILE